MKNFVPLILALAAIVILAACSKAIKAEATPPDLDNPHFTGIVLEIYESSCVMQVTDIGNGHLAEGMEVLVHISISDCPQFGVGDQLLIVFDGKVGQSLPPQVVNVLSIHKV